MEAATPANKRDPNPFINLKLDSVEAFEPRIGLAPGTFKKLLEETSADWQFVIQLACLLEAALLEVLVKHLQNERLRAHLENRLRHSDRIKLAFQTDCITKREADVLSAVARVRNQYAHSIKNLGVALPDFVKALSFDKRVELLRDLTGIPHELAKRILTNDEADSDWFLKEVRNIIWLHALDALAQLESTDRDAETKKIQFELAEAARKGFASHPSFLDALTQGEGLFGRRGFVSFPTNAS